MALKKRFEWENAFETAAACLRPQDKAARAQRKGESYIRLSRRLPNADSLTQAAGETAVRMGGLCLLPFITHSVDLIGKLSHILVSPALAALD